ncbi:MAG: TolC family protein, partial [Alphaproteobacteria bacterium]|nr:TolC family protein [Alphaproteobacteria bacterium]
VEQSVLRDAATAFVDVVRNQAVLELNIKNEQRLARQLEATRDRFRVGDDTRTDVSQAESRLSSSRADRLQAQGDLEISRAVYRTLVGEAPGRLSAPTPLGALPSSWEEAVAISVAEAPNVIAADFDARASADDADEVRGELLPTVSLEGSAKRAFDTAGEESRVDTLA